MWFSVVCTLIDNDIRNHSGQNVVDSRGDTVTGAPNGIFFGKISVRMEVPLTISNVFAQRFPGPDIKATGCKFHNRWADLFLLS